MVGLVGSISFDDDDGKNTEQVRGGGMGRRMRGVEGRKPLLDHMLKWKKGGRGYGRAGVAVQ